VQKKLATKQRKLISFSLKMDEDAIDRHLDAMIVLAQDTWAKQHERGSN